jgi:hypothetical protein
MDRKAPFPASFTARLPAALVPRELPPRLAARLFPVDFEGGPHATIPRTTSEARTRADEAISLALLAGASVTREEGRAIFRDTSGSPADGEAKRLLVARRLLDEVAANPGEASRERLARWHRELLDVGEAWRDPHTTGLDLDFRGAPEPPCGEELRSALAAVFGMADSRASDSPFLHPILKASWLAAAILVLRPFRGGNLAMSRLVFAARLSRDGYSAAFEWPLVTAALLASLRAQDLPSRAHEERDVRPFFEFELETLARARRLAGCGEPHLVASLVNRAGRPTLATRAQRAGFVGPGRVPQPSRAEHAESAG